MAGSLFHASISVTRDDVLGMIGRVKLAVDEASSKAADAILREAQRRVKVGATRKLHDGLRVRKLADGRFDVGVEGVREAQFVENGTVKMHAAPYLHPAATVGGQVLKEAAEAKIREAAS